MNIHLEGESDTALRCDGVQGLAVAEVRKQRERVRKGDKQGMNIHREGEIRLRIAM